MTTKMHTSVDNLTHLLEAVKNNQEQLRLILSILSYDYPPALAPKMDTSAVENGLAVSVLGLLDQVDTRIIELSDVIANEAQTIRAVLELLTYNKTDEDLSYTASAPYPTPSAQAVFK